MLTSIEFTNFKVLRAAVLPVGRFTLLIGPNGSGKSTVFQALRAVQNSIGDPRARLRHVDARSSSRPVRVRLVFTFNGREHTATCDWKNGKVERAHSDLTPAWLESIRVYSLDADAISASVPLKPKAELGERGDSFVAVLDRLRDSAPERFDALNQEMHRWLPEYDRLLFDTPDSGKRAFALRTAAGGHKIAAKDLSHGTLFALLVLTLAYLPEPPKLIGLEEPDHGLHPRLLRDVRDALLRLAYPEEHGDEREPTQVIATTHSPYMLDLFRDRPEHIVIANKVGNEATFTRLIDHPKFEEIIGEAPLGEVWYSGVLGGIPDHG